MTIIIAVASILAIALAVWLANQVLPFSVCPICAGVFLTWVGLLGAHFAGYQVTLTVPAILMGGSVVGIAYQLEKRNSGSPPGTRMLFKVLFIPTGFVAAYAVLEQWWAVFLLALVLLVAVSFWLLSYRSLAGPREETAGNIEKNLKDCC